jgi:peptidoglycan/LPS O-acetylase OafA/YrhL
MEVSEYISKGGHLREIDGVRGAAVLMVVLLHTIFGIMKSEFIIPFAQPIFKAFFGGAGVDLFFVLSGFLIGGILIDNKNASNYFKVFWIRRATRILPVYLLLLATYMVAKRLAHNYDAMWFHAFLMQDPLPTWTYFTFIQNYFMAAANSGAARWVGITWSLAVEEQFYLVFPFVVYFLRTQTILIIAVISIFVAFLLRIYLWENYGFYTGYFPTPARADSLMFGIIAAYVIRSKVLTTFKKNRVYIDLVSLVFAYILIWKSAAIGSSTCFSLRSALFCYLIIRIFLTDGIFRAFLRSRFMVFMGVISYSLYMYHQAINGLFHGWFLGQVPVIDSCKSMIVGIAVILTSVFLAMISTEYYEKPIRNFGRRFIYMNA